jgi:hypothetical protein
MTTTITIPVEIENLLDSILYAGAFSTYSWYSHLAVANDGRRASVGIYTNEGHTATVSRILDARTLAETIERIVSERLLGWQDVLHGARNDDFDANSADTVLQTAVLGKVVWG